MAIQGLISPEVSPQPQALDLTDAGAVTTEALGILGVIDDKEAAYESISNDYKALTEQTKSTDIRGELYVDIPYSMLGTKAMVAAIDGHFGSDYPETYVYNNLWTPGTEAGSYSDEQLAKASGTTPTARLAVHSDEASEEPLLHFLNQPFDEYAKEQWGGGDKTQLKAVAEAKASFEQTYPELTMSALGHRAFLLLGLQHRITGEKMPLSWGFMRDGNLPRTEVDGSSVVGCVRSRGGKLRLRLGLGHARSDRGVGLSMGQAEA